MDDYRKKMRLHLEAAVNDKQISELTAVALAASSYRSLSGMTGTDIPTSWPEVAPPADDQKTGYDAEARYHAPSRTLVMANRGTEGLSSEDDVYQSVRARLAGKDRGQILGAFNYFQDALRAAKKEGVAVEQVLMVGHSLGGGLAEATAIYGAALAKRAGVSGSLPIRAVGIGSAGYRPAAESLAKTLGLQASSASISHYCRQSDIVHRLFKGERFGATTLIGNVFIGRIQPGVGPQGRTQWYAFRDPVLNHRRELYFAFFDVPFADHVWRNANKEFGRGKGSKPAWTPSRTQPPGW